MMKRTVKTLLAAACLAPGLLFAAPVKYDVDAGHSYVLFNILHYGVGNNYGAFTKFSGSFTLDKEDATKSSFEFEIDTDSVTTFNAKRDQHVKSPDFLNTQQHPKVTFKSESVKKISDKEYEITGPLTLLGVTKPVTAKLVKIGETKDPRGNDRIGGEASFSFKRSDYGMNQMLDNLGDEINLKVAIEAVKKKDE